METESGCSVLIVEDDPELRHMMVQMLALEGFDPEGAADGVEALQKLRGPGRRPHVIVLDMMMPRMDGWTFRQEQRRDATLAPIPVVILSAAPRDRLHVGAAAVLMKPFDYDSLLTTIRAYC